MARPCAMVNLRSIAHLAENVTPFIIWCPARPQVFRASYLRCRPRSGLLVIEDLGEARPGQADPLAPSKLARRRRPLAELLAIRRRPSCWVEPVDYHYLVRYGSSPDRSRAAAAGTSPSSALKINDIGFNAFRSLAGAAPAIDEQRVRQVLRDRRWLRNRFAGTRRRARRVARLSGCSDGTGRVRSCIALPGRASTYRK
jgi:hypothetical protein